MSVADAFKQYISSKYDQRPDMFADDLLIIDRLRAEAVNVQEPHVSGISRLVTYAAQLKWLGGKFPIDVRASPETSNVEPVQTQEARLYIYIYIYMHIHIVDREAC